MNVILKFVALQSVILLNAMESFLLHLWLLDIKAKPILWHFNLDIEVESQNVIDTDRYVDKEAKRHTCRYRDREEERHRDTDRYRARGRKPLHHRHEDRYVDKEAQRHRQI